MKVAEHSIQYDNTPIVQCPPVHTGDFELLTDWGIR